MGVNMNMGYVKSIPGILKLVEFILLLLAFSCTSDCCYSGHGYHGYHGNSRISFYLAVTVIGWLIVIGLFIVFFLSLTESMKQINFNLVVFITSMVFAVLLLISGSLVADYTNFWRHWRGYAWWDTLVAATVFGFFALIAFIIDAVMHVSAIKGGGSGGGNAPPANA